VVLNESEAVVKCSKNVELNSIILIYLFLAV